jgi:hypothetical protein
LIVPGGVDVEVADEFAGGGVDDPDVEVADEHENAGSGVGSADADVVQSAVDPQGQAAVGVDAVGADPLVAVESLPGGCFGAGGVGGRGGALVGQRAVWAAVVVFVDEVVEVGLQLGEGGGAGLVAEVLFEGLVEAFDLAAGGGVVGVELIWMTPRRRISCSSALRPPLPPASRVVKTIPLSVRVEYGMPWAATVLSKSVTTMGPVTRVRAVTESA